MQGKRKCWFIVFGLFALLAIVVLGYSTVICVDHAYICEYTGSRYGFRKWFVGNGSHFWAKRAPLEDFISQEAPKELKHRWTSYAGTGKNIFGSSIEFGHGAPGAMIRLNDKIMRRWIDHNDPKLVRAFYDLLCTDARDACEKRADEIMREVAAY